MPVEQQNNVRYEDFTIASGATESNVLNLGCKPLVGIGFPSAFTGTKVTVQGSGDGVNFFSILDLTFSASTGYSIDPVIMCPWSYVKLVSDASEAAERTIFGAFRPV